MSQPIAVDLIIKNLTESTEKAKERAQKASEVLLGPLWKRISPRRPTRWSTRRTGSS